MAQTEELTTAAEIPLLDRGVQEFVDELAAAGGPPIYTLSPAQARAVLDRLQRRPVQLAPADVEEGKIPGGPTGEIPIRIVRPKGVAEVLPVIVYMHGGGWVLGDYLTHDRLVRQLAVGAGAVVVFVEYTPSPEAQFPVAIEQAYAATKWVAENGQRLRVDPSRLAVAGDSVGGNMVAAVTLLAKQRRTPFIGFQLMFYPVTDASFDTPSYFLYDEGPWLTRQSMRWFWDQYAPDVSVRSQPLASPLRASLEELEGLPPALIITDENDVLRDEGEAYAHKLGQAGVTVTATRVLGTIHDFVMLNALAETPPTRNAIAQACVVLRDALSTRH
jgi:acetyl esterase